MRIINGKECSLSIEQWLREAFAKSQPTETPSLQILMVGNNPASLIYVRRKMEKALSLGFKATIQYLDPSLSTEQLIQLIHNHNVDSSLHGIIVQMPLPSHIDAQQVLNSIAPQKDIDGLGATNLGRLAQTMDFDRAKPLTEGFVPSTPLGCTWLLNSITPLAGKQVVVVGRSNIVGKPMSLLLSALNATVTLTHSKTAQLHTLTQQADVVVLSTGQPKHFDERFFKPKAIIIDVGITSIISKGKEVIVGDLHSRVKKSEALQVTYTPVPGGVGPMTVIALMYNLWLAYNRQHKVVIATDLTLLNAS